MRRMIRGGTGRLRFFYMGINLGAFLCAFVCGTLGERLGWHWGFGAGGGGDVDGADCVYVVARPRVLGHVGDPPAGRGGSAPVFFVGTVVVAGIAGVGMFFMWMRLRGWGDLELG